MYPETAVAALIGCTREELLPRREGRTVKKNREILWTPEGLRSLLSELGIPPEKTPPNAFASLEQQREERPPAVELTVYRTTGNPGIILCHLEARVVRCRIKPGTADSFRPRVTIHAHQEVGDLYRIDLTKRTIR
jgi:hypothetical protein